MERYIGLDVHAASTTLAVLGPSGKRLRSQVVETNGRALRQALQAIAGEKHVCLEEGEQSGWLYEILSPHAHRVVVARQTQSRGQKSDVRDAFALADQLRTGTVETPVFKERGRFGTLRELTRAYGLVAQDVVRTKNRLKSAYRSRGVSVTGSKVYEPSARDDWLRKLPAASRARAQTLHAQLEVLTPVRDAAEKAVLAEARQHPVTKLIETCPGLGPIRVAQLVSIVVTPHRFRTKRQFWSYCGLGIEMRSSSDWVQGPNRDWMRAAVQQTRGLTRSYNRTMKSIFKGAATTVILAHRTGPLFQHYEQLLAAGTKPNLAKLTLARQIAATALAMWKSEKEYDTTRYTPQVSKLVS